MSAGEGDRVQEEGQAGGRRLDWKVWRRVLGFGLAYRREVGLVALFAVLTPACDLGFPLITRATVDEVVTRGPGARLAPYAALYLALVGLLSFSVRGFIRRGGRITTHVAHDIRRAGFARLQELSFGFYDRRPVGWLMARMTSDCERLARIVAWGFLDLVWGSVSMAGVGLALLLLHPGLGLLVVGVLPLLLWVSVLFQRRILQSARRVRKVNSRLTAAYSESLMGVRTTKVLAREAEALAEFQSLSAEMGAASVTSALQSAVYLPLVITLGSLATGVALARGGVEVAALGMSLGTLVAFLTYTALLFDPVQELARVFAELQMAQASAERVVGLLDEQPEVRDTPAVAAAVARVEAAGRAAGRALDGGPERIGDIELEDVAFAYRPGRPVIDGVSLRVAAGSRIALVGPTGGGKSTLVNLICRFYEPTRGRILMGGVDYRQRSLAWLQSALGMVLQTPHLFSGTVRENIRYGRLEASDAEVEEAARVANAHGFIVALERGYDSQVGEGGGRLSTGQKQLVSLARAVLARPQLLVMDEATSSVDTETEGRIQEALERVLAGRTSFLIAHRLSTIRSADLILFVAGGRVVEQGDHRELLRRRGRYHELVLNQRLRGAVGAIGETA